MSTDEKPFEKLFSYGTLQAEPVQRVAFGRTLEGKSDTLQSYKLELIESEDQDFVTRSGADRHRNVQFTGSTADKVPGTVFDVTSEELARCDAYEPTDYKRVEVQLASGTKAWVYLNDSVPTD